MAADQWKKRVNSSSVVYTSREQYKAKKKKLGLPPYDFILRSSISLEWDDKKRSVVAKREQIGIARRDLTQSIDAVSFPLCHNILADVFSVPREIFELKNLIEVLSYEVWQTHLSEKERKILTQFLPKGAEAHKVIQELLAGDNFHFGNPFLKWGASLCFGNLHPDAIIHQAHCFKANKKAYYLELQKYHIDMIGNLQMWKERWASCKDPEKEIVQKIWRSRKHAGKSLPSHANESRLCDPDENLIATSESCSWAADEKACSSDTLYFMSRTGESQRWVCGKDLMVGKYDNSSDGPKEVTRPRKGVKLHKRNIQCDDGAKYMSYIKVSKVQHQRVRSSIKHSSNSIQPRSLNHVLGNLNTFHVQPFEVFEEEERQKLHEHWLQLANRDLPAGFVNWRRRQKERLQLTVSLGQEMEGKLKSLKEDEENENSHNMLPEQKNNVASDGLEPTNTVEDEEKETYDSFLQQNTGNRATSLEPAIRLEDEEKKSPGCIFQEQADNGAANCELTMEDENELTMEDENESVPASTQNHNLLQVTSLHGRREFHSKDLDSDDNHVIAKTEDFPPNVIEYPKNLNHVDVPAGQGHPPTSVSDVWPTVSMGNAFHQHSSSVSHEYASANELSLGHAEVLEEQPAQLINLESDTREEDGGKNLMHRQFDDESFFGRYPNQDRPELLQSFFKGQGSLAYHHKQRRTELDFQPAASVMTETGQLPRHFLREQLHPSMVMELRQKRLNDLYMPQNIQENLYSEVGRYSVPRQEHFSPLNIPDWAVNTVRMSAPPQMNLNGGESLSQNWFCGELRASGCWSGSEGAVGPNQSIGNESSADQSLFSVLSQCNGLRSGAHSDSMGSTERLFTQSGNYGGTGMGGGVPTTSNVLPRTANPLNYLSGHEANAGLKTNNNLGWVSFPHQNNALQDSMGSWNR